MIDLSRRQILRASLFVAAAPFIVRASSLMKVRPHWIAFEPSSADVEELEYTAYVAGFDRGKPIEREITMRKTIIDGKVYWIGFGPTRVFSA